MTAKRTDRSKGARDATSLLIRGHVEIRELFGQLERTTPRGAKNREGLLERLGHELRIHSRIEEQVFYPAFRKAAGAGKDAHLFFEALEEHALIDLSLAILEDSTPDSAVFGARSKVLKDIVERHIEEEERGMLALARKRMDAAELARLYDELAALERELRAALRGREFAAGSNRD